ncbi:MAG TPA: SUMF1/EgtB/PvdO family nonheme iron enzyme [Fluviicola sp.]|nr:SUMF1/EgtB/PvdO family nonheme iron enzyme [Fluviicola sp.]
MGQLLVLFCFLGIAYSPLIAQPVDSIQISMSTRPYDTLLLNQVNAINGRYKIPAENWIRYPALANYILVQPTTLVGPDKTLRITSQHDLTEKSPAYELRRYPFVKHEPPADTTSKPVGQYYPEGTFWVADGVYVMEGPHFDTIKLRYRNNADWKYLWSDYYVKYKVGLSNDESPDSLLLSLDREFQQYRSTVAQPLVNELLEPFYFAQSEVTNAQYREFVQWVRDSVIFDRFYHELPEYDAVELLNCTKKQRALLNDYNDPDSMMAYVARYGFNFNYFKDKKINLYYDDDYYPYIAPLFIQTAERFYKRRELNWDRFSYCSSTTSPTPVYPDTLCWIKDTPGAEYEALEHSYFWHPAYNHYPVVGLSEAQMKAYCDWLQRRKNKELEDAPYTIRVELPQLFHYEMAVKHCAPAVLRNKVDARAEAPFIIERSPEDAPEFVNRAMPFSPKEMPLIREKYPVVADWHSLNQTFPIWNLNGGVSEYCTESTTPGDQMTVLGGNHKTGLVDRHEIQQNTALYPQIVPANEGKSTVGFRPVIYLDWKK